jgi:Protein of unknown function DUF104
MALKVNASFQNGVFVPAERPTLADRERVRLTIETTNGAVASSLRAGRDEGQARVGLRTDSDLAIPLDFHPDGC